MFTQLLFTFQVTKTVEKEPEKKVEDSVDTLDLDDLDFSVSKPTLSAEASAGRTDAQII